MIIKLLVHIEIVLLFLSDGSDFFYLALFICVISTYILDVFG
jgi:hypothetical protein